MNSGDETYKKSAETVYTQIRQMQQFAMQMQGEYGKWLISSLLFLHGAAIGGLLFKVTSEHPPAYLSALWWFVAGILLALASGFATWCNFSFVADQFERWADHRMLIDRTYWPAEQAGNSIDVTRWVAILCGILSASCILGGSFTVVCMWR
jgi:hypothetical protein